MAILIRCNKCKNDLKLSAKKCSMCGTNLNTKRKTYRVIVRSMGRKVTRTVTNLELAKEIEGKLTVEKGREENNLEKKTIRTCIIRFRWITNGSRNAFITRL